MRVRGFLLLAAAVASARASDPPAPASDPISAAKRDFAAIKAQVAPQEPSSGLAAIDARDDGQATPGAPSPPYPSLRSAPEAPGTRGGTGNWLVDAMEKGTDRAQASPGGVDSARGDLELLRDTGGPESREGRDTRQPGAADSAASRAPAGDAFNPLDAFMEGWVSAQDRELLLPAKRGEGLPGGERAGTLPGLDFGPQGASRGGAPASRDAALADSDSRAANPYVADLDPAPLKALAPPDPAGFAPLLLPDLSRGMSPPALDSGLFDAPKPPGPDFMQPAEDDKYFRQMKRF